MADTYHVGFRGCHYACMLAQVTEVPRDSLACLMTERSEGWPSRAHLRSCGQRCPAPGEPRQTALHAARDQSSPASPQSPIGLPALLQMLSGQCALSSREQANAAGQAHATSRCLRGCNSNWQAIPLLTGAPPRGASQEGMCHHASSRIWQCRGIRSSQPTIAAQAGCRPRPAKYDCITVYWC